MRAVIFPFVGGGVTHFGIDGMHRMRLFALCLGSNGWDDIGRTIHVVIRRRGDDGPMWLDITQMQTPRRIAGLIHKFNRTIGAVGGLGMLFGNAGRQMTVLIEPPVFDRTVRINN